MKECLCWHCNALYLNELSKCPKCFATNANIDWDTAQNEVLDNSKIVSKYQKIADDVINDIPLCSEYESDARYTWPTRWEELIKRLSEFNT